MNGISYKQLLSLQLEPGYIHSLLNPLDIIKYEKNIIFKIIKFFSTLLPFLFFDYIQNYLTLILIINIMEASISDYTNGNQKCNIRFYFIMLYLLL